jgi:hypothetical protein
MAAGQGTRQQAICNRNCQSSPRARPAGTSGRGPPMQELPGAAAAGQPIAPRAAVMRLSCLAQSPRAIPARQRQPGLHAPTTRQISATPPPAPPGRGKAWGGGGGQGGAARCCMAGDGPGASDGPARARGRPGMHRRGRGAGDPPKAVARTRPAMRICLEAISVLAGRGRLGCYREI